MDKPFSFWSWRPGHNNERAGWTFTNLRDAAIFSTRSQFDESAYEIREELESGDRKIYNKRKIKSLLKRMW